MRTVIARQGPIVFLLIAASTLAAQTRPLAFTSNEASHDVSIIDIASNTVIGTVKLPARPRGIQVSPDQRRLYVALSDEDLHHEGGTEGIAVIDVARRRIIATYPIGSDPEQFAVTPDGDRKSVV